MIFRQFQLFQAYVLNIYIYIYKKEKETRLSRKIWEIKDEGLDFEIKWKILERAQPFSPISGVCGLCTLEKWYILFKSEEASLNKEEIAGHCFHKEPALLKNS